MHVAEYFFSAETGQTGKCESECGSERRLGRNGGRVGEDAVDRETRSGRVWVSCYTSTGRSYASFRGIIEMKLRVTLLLVAMAVLGLRTPAQESKTPRLIGVDDLFGMREVHDPQITRDGKFTAYTVTSTSLKEDKAETRIWMVAATGGLLPEMAWLFVGLTQFPIYLTPQLLKPIVQRMVPPPAVST